MSVKAELTAVQALRDYLLLELPAKVASINAERAAVLKAARAGNYTVTGNIGIGTARGSESAVALTAGVRTATQVASDITAAAIAGITASVDAQDRLVLTNTTAPVAGAPSVISVAADDDNAAFGWSKGGVSIVRAALVAPDNQGILDGEPDLVDLGSGFGVILGRRRTAPRSQNIRDDMHVVTVDAEVFAAEPNGNVAAAHELIASAVRAVREVILEDRTLDGLVHLTELPSIQYEARTFRFATGGANPLMSSAPVQVTMKVFERT